MVSSWASLAVGLSMPGQWRPSGAHKNSDWLAKTPKGSLA